MGSVSNIYLYALRFHFSTESQLPLDNNQIDETASAVMNGQDVIVEDWHSHGLKNYGNTCYINVTVQVMLHLRFAYTWLNSNQVDEEFCVEASVAHNLRRLLQTKNRKRIIQQMRDTPREIETNEPLFPPKQQMDAYDFMESLFQMIEVVTVANPFQLQLHRFLKCCCGYVSNGEETATAIQLDLFGERIQYLNTLLEMYFDEVLDDNENLYKCPECKKKSSDPEWKGSVARKEVRVGTKNGLIIRLKRFTDAMNKNNAKIIVPQTIEVPGLDSTAKYQLTALINHHGTSMSAGHYTVMIRHPTRGTWFEFDDAKVKEFNALPMDPQKAYVLLYAVDVDQLLPSTTVPQSNDADDVGAQPNLDTDCNKYSVSFFQI